MDILLIYTGICIGKIHLAATVRISVTSHEAIVYHFHSLSVPTFSYTPCSFCAE
jgi:hypothetical protein